MTAAPPGDLGRVARRLAIRARRQAAGAFHGAYASAFRGGGIEFEESRPYVPGDDLATLDWNATARTGEPYVKRFREERDQTVLLVLDVSASMAFGSGARTKAEAAAWSAGLLAAAAGRAGDRVGLLAFADGIRAEHPPRRGPGHVDAVVRAALAASRACAGGTGLETALERARAHARHRALIFVLSDFRDDPASGAALRAAARRHELVSVAILDPREVVLVPAGVLRLADPERPDRVYELDSRSPGVRARFAAAAAVRRRALERRLRRAGADLLWLSTSEDPLPRLVRFFRERAAHRRTS